MRGASAAAVLLGVAGCSGSGRSPVVVYSPHG